ncbi:MAG TPA: VWA domain-containing protein [Acidobacteriota bacterium]|nr:VWA domain-containing protein [Acidobacteriota bacterium]
MRLLNDRSGLRPATFWLALLTFTTGFACWSVAQSEQPAPMPENQQPIRVEAQTVRVPVVVLKDEDGETRLVTDLGRDNFIVYEDGQRQEVTSFTRGTEEPLTIVLLLEDSETVQYLKREVYRPAGMFVSQIMGNDDYAAIIAFDRKPHLLTDFTRNEQALLDQVRVIARNPPALSEGALFDAVKFTLVGGVLDNVQYKGLANVEGRTAVLLIASGIDGFSRINYGQARRIAANSGVPIYALGVGESLFVRYSQYMSGAQRIRFRQAQNQLRVLAEESGGRFYSVRFQGAYDSVLESIAAMLRFQYTLGYLPTRPLTTDEDEVERKIKVLVDLDGDGQPDEDGVELQYRQKYWIGEEVEYLPTSSQ